MNSTEKEFCKSLKTLVDNVESRFVVAFSGGADSLALLSMCVKTIGACNIVAVYVNHNLRSESELAEEIELNEANCRKLGVKLVVREVEPGLIKTNAKGVGVEAAARKIRYSILEEERINNNCDFILTAHHRDDQVETVLMAMRRNAPITALRGIAEKKGVVLRPLLNFSKKELEEYLSFVQLHNSYDSTNSDNSILRNHIRNEVLPSEKQKEGFCDEILSIRNRVCSETKEIEPTGDSIELDKFRTYSESEKYIALYGMWDKVVQTSMPQTLIRRVCKAVEDGGTKTVSSNFGTFCSYNGILYLINKHEDALFKNFSTDFDEKCECYSLPGNIILQRKETGKSTDISIDFSLFKGKSVIRFPKEGESVKLKDGRKTINKLLQDMKVPAIFRTRVPVISDDDGICVVFGSVYGGRDRICVKMRSALALNNSYKYICYKGN